MKTDGMAMGRDGERIGSGDDGGELLLRGGVMLGADGRFVEGQDVLVRDGRISEIGRGLARSEASGGTSSSGSRSTSASGGHSTNSSTRVIDLDGRWLVPGLVDAHAHIAWTAFDESDRETTDPHEVDRLVTDALLTTLRSGVTSVRDAGGADAQLRARIRSGAVAGPRLAISERIVGRDDASTPDAMRNVVRELASHGVDWIKLAATGGLADPGSIELEPHLDEDTIHAAVTEASAHGLRVLVHAWGGPAIDHAIAAGVASIEHGIFLTEAQAAAAASAGTVLVPTLRIYQDVAELASTGVLPAALEARARAVVAAHPEAVRIARDAGVRIALGTDFGSPAQHGRVLEELSALVAAGLGPEEALVAATRVGAELVEGPDTDGGVFAPGRRFDAIVLGQEPSAAAFDAPGLVTAVFQGGRLAPGSLDPFAG